jgi:hypothetical protein
MPERAGPCRDDDELEMWGLNTQCLTVHLDSALPILSLSKWQRDKFLRLCPGAHDENRIVTVFKCGSSAIRAQFRGATDWVLVGYTIFPFFHFVFFFDPSFSVYQF